MRSNLITLLLLALVCVSFGKSFGKKRTVLRLQKRESVGPDLESLLQQDSEHWKEWLRGLLFSEADLEEISTILVNHRMDLTSLLSLNSVSDLVNIGIKLGDAQRIWDKAHEGVTSTIGGTSSKVANSSDATAAAQPVVVNIQINVPTLTNSTANSTTTENAAATENKETTSEKTTTKRKRTFKKLKRDASALVSFLNGTVTNSDLSVIAAILDAHRLTVDDLSNVTAEELVKIGIALNDATKIVGKAQTSSAASPSQNQDIATPIDADWLTSVVVEPSDILTILPILKSHHILTVDDLKLITADDLINIGIALGDAKRIVARVNNQTETESASAPTVNVDAVETPAETNTTQTPQTIIVQVTLNAADLTNNSTATATATPAEETTTKRKRFIMEDEKKARKEKANRGGRGRGSGRKGRGNFRRQNKKVSEEARRRRR